jgi:hypothetical protein
MDSGNNSRPSSLGTQLEPLGAEEPKRFNMKEPKLVKRFKIEKSAIFA